MELLRQVVPLHRELLERGQIELTTTPFYHPILPLLWDKRLARRAMPDVTLPKHLEGYAEDAARAYSPGGRVPRKALRPEAARHVALGRLGLPGASIPAMAEAGIQWIATDEEILSCSTDGWVSRDGNGYLRNPGDALSPLARGGAGQVAANRLPRPRHERPDRLPLPALRAGARGRRFHRQAGGHRQRHRRQRRPPAHAGEHHSRRRELLGILSQRRRGVPARPVSPRGAASEDQAGAGGRLPGRDTRPPTSSATSSPAVGSSTTSASGSAIPSAIGPGTCCTKRGSICWASPARKSKPADKIARAWEELYIAEGSDWFWWFGDSHSSAQDGLFDRLFRKHLQNVYTCWTSSRRPNWPAPSARGTAHAQLYSEPTGLLRVKVNGRRTYFEWINAGHYVCGGPRGAMSMVTAGLISDLYFGFDTERLLLRLDARGGPFREQLADVDALRVVFLQPAGFELLVAHPQPEGAGGATVAPRRR